MTPKEFKTAKAITEFFYNSIKTGQLNRWYLRRRRDDRLMELLFEFAEATKEAHLQATKEAHQQNIPMISPATDVI